MTDSRSFRILHVVASLQGGAAQHVVQLSQALRGQGHFCAIAAPVDQPQILESIRLGEIPFFPVELHSVFPLEAIFDLRSLFEYQSWTHIHVHGHRAALVARLASRLITESPALIYTIHGYHPSYYPDRFSRYAVNRLEQALASMTDRYICVSASAQRDLAQAVPSALSRSVIVENAIPSISYEEEDKQVWRRAIRQRFAIPEDAFVIGTVARLQWQKGISRLIRAFAPLYYESSDVHLLIVGDGPRCELLKTLSKSLKIADRCHFAGYQPRTHEFYAAFDLFVLPSIWEGLPLTILEAWMAGTPVAATRVSGIWDILEDGQNGFFLMPTIQGITDTLRAIRGQWHVVPTVIQTASAQLVRRFALERMVEQTLQVYRDAAPKS